MANYKFVNADQLDADLQSVANVIKEKGKTTGKLSFPDGFTSAINSISTGVEVKRASGTFAISKSDPLTIDCGFKPDLVYIYMESEDSYYNFSASLAFEEEKREAYIDVTTYLYSARYPLEVQGHALETGFKVSILSIYQETVFHYTAVKYT